MKTFILALLVCCIATVTSNSRAEDKKTAEVQLKALVEKVNVKLKADKVTEDDLAGELKEFDALLLEHKDEKTDDVARILYMKAVLFVQVLDQPAKSLPLVKQIQSDFPGTEVAKNTESMLKQLEHLVEFEKIQSELVVGAIFPTFEEKDLDGKPLSVTAFKGKVLLVEFWATWCGPCVRELPNVIKAYQKYHDKGMEIVGVSLDDDEDAVRGFIKKNKIPWQQFFDGKGRQNKLAEKYGINGIPATYLLDKEGKIIAKNLRGGELTEQLEKTFSK